MVVFSIYYSNYLKNQKNIAAKSKIYQIYPYNFKSQMMGKILKTIIVRYADEEMLELLDSFHTKTTPTWDS